MSTTQPPADELISMLEAHDADVEAIKALIHENLNQTKDASFLNSLVDCYMSNGYTRCQEILVGICEPHDKHLFDKLNDCLKGTSRHRTLTLLSHIAYKQPSWLHKISQHSLLSSVIKVLKTDSDITNLMTGVLLVATLFPVIPSAIGPNHLNEICEIFTRLATLNTKKPAHVPEVYLMHLHVAIYALFHRLYSLFPCNFLNYLRNYCHSHREHIHVFNDTIRPMLDHVRMHPMLVTYTKEAEITTNRWKSMETHDIVVECSKLSLDHIEGTREDRPVSDYLTPALKQLRYSREGDYSNISSQPPPIFPSTQSIVGQSSFELGNWSPSVICGLTTPPILTSPEFEYAGATGGSAVAGEKLSEPKKEHAVASTSSSQMPVPHSPLKLESGPFKFSESDISKLHRSDSISKSDALTGSPQSKLPRVTYPISKLSGMAGHPVLFYRPEEPEVKSEKQDMTDYEVATIFEQGISNIEAVGSVGLRSAFNRSGRGSAQWCQSPYFDYLQEAQRGRSYSMGKRMPPRRATVEASSRRESYIVRSRSLPNLSVVSQAAETEKSEEPGKATASNRQLLPNSQVLYAALPLRVYHSTSSTQQLSTSGMTSNEELRHSPPSIVQLSPPEILDRYLQLCASTHDSKASHSASSGPPARYVSGKSGHIEEMNILRVQLQLLHSQLLYERHKREIHAERNRRLLGKAKQSKALEEQNNAVKDQMQLMEKELAKMSQFMGKLRREKMNILEVREQENRKHQEELRMVMQEKIRLEKAVTELQEEVAAAKRETCGLQKDLEKLQSELFNCHHEFNVIQNQVALNTKLKAEIVKLSRELLLMGELNKKYNEKLNDLQNNLHYEYELSSLRKTYDREIQSLRQSLETREAQFESTKCRNAELENLLSKKDKIIAEQKKLMKGCKDEYEAKLQAVEDKYIARGTICQNLESGVTRLYRTIERQSPEDVEIVEYGFCSTSDIPPVGVCRRRRVSEPINIEHPCVDESRSHYLRLEQRMKKRLEQKLGTILSDSEPFMDSDSPDDVFAERSGGLIPTPHSIASTADVTD